MAEGQVLRVAPEAFLILSSGVTDPIGRLGGSASLASLGASLGVGEPRGQVLLLASSRSTASRAVMIGIPWKLPIGTRSRLSPEAMRSAWPVTAAAMT